MSSPNSNSNPHKVVAAYDVFLSFRGDDTRSGFTSHLHDNLIREGHKTFFDDESLKKGKAISEGLLKAIEVSRSSIVVLSENYAFSGWCLTELAKIVECMDTNGQIVLPIFYHVDPSHVRNQTGSYEKAFKKHEDNYNLRYETVVSWRHALERVGSLAGWPLKDRDSEAKFIRDFITKLSNILRKKSHIIEQDPSDPIIGLDVVIPGRSNIPGQTANVQGVYWFPGSEFPVSSIDSTLFTHIFCAFADLNPTTYQVTISSSNQAQFKNFTQTVQQKNPSVKTLLSIGGGSANAEDFAAMASQASRRKSFIDSSISLAKSNNFHGLDLDWQYPNTTENFTNFGTLLTEWRAAVAAESRTSGKAALLLTAAVFRSSNYYSLNYPVQAISNSLDWINAMTYDYYAPGWSRNSTGPPAALYSGASDQVNGDAGIKDWIQSGLSAKKIVLGLPFYGYAWRLVNANNHGLFAPANGPAISADGSLGYGQIRNFISQNVATAGHNRSVVTDYTYSGTTWIGYDDTQSVSTKVTYAKSKGLLGYFAWHVGADSNWALSQTASRKWAETGENSLHSTKETREQKKL